MSKKAAKSAAAGKAKEVKEQREETLQAVVLADSFETTFNPFTRERPRCLLPLANIPIIEYTLEFLAKAGVQDVYIYCGAHAEQVEEYLRFSRWRLPSSPFWQLELVRTTSRSVGDVMRDLDSRDLITGDFLVVSGDVVSNIPLAGALAKHRARRAKNKNAIMTMVLREAGTFRGARSREPSPVYVLDPTHNRCLHYEEMHSWQRSRMVSIDADLFSAHSEIDVRNDLMDCYIDICTPDVLALWTDSFDYETPRKHFLYGVLKDHELNGKTIHTHLVRDHYAARVRDLRAYDAISKDVVSRWAYPLCPESNLLPGQSYTFQPGNIYLEQGVVLARSCVIKRRTVIGQKTSVGDGSIIRNSVIGRRCQIGRNVTIDGAYVWDDAVISDETEVRQAIVAAEAVVGPQCTVEPGALISYRAVVAKGTIVSGSSRITAKAVALDADDGVANDVAGPAASAAFDSDDDDDDDDDDEADSRALSGLVYQMPDLAISDSSISTLNSDGHGAAEVHPARESSGSFTTVLSDDARDDDFYHDATSSIFDAIQRDEGPDIVQLELQGLRLGNDANYHEVRRAIVTAFLKRIHQLMDERSLAVDEAVGRMVTRYQMVFRKTIFDLKMDAKSDQVDLLLSIQKEVVRRRKGDRVLLFMIKQLYEADVLEEDGINQWWADGRSSADPEMVRVRAQAQQLVDWLAEAEEEEEEEEEEGDDEG